jgi:hypothetical protein
MKDLIGKKVKGFKFESSEYDGLQYNSYMDEYIGEEGCIVCYNERYNCYKVQFKDDYWDYPASLIEQHLVEEWEIGKEYEFTHESMRGWGKRELVAILPKEYKDRYIVSSRSIKKGWTYMSDIRYIEP